VAKAGIVIGTVVVAGVLAAVAIALVRGHRTRVAAKQDAGVVMLDPKDLLFSLPTLSDGLPDGEKPERLPPDAYHLHEDDWRQVEFIGVRQADEVDAELKELRTFVAQHRKGYGFTEVHVRRSRPDGLAPLQVESSALESLLPPRARRRPLAVGNPPWGPSIVRGYAIEIGTDAVLYVQVSGSYLVTIGLPLSWRRGASPDADKVLVAISRTLNLRLVDWPAGDWVPLE
jgi:hypothetical protein